MFPFSFQLSTTLAKWFVLVLGLTTLAFLGGCGQTANETKHLPPMALGEYVYNKRCVICHQQDGGGAIRGQSFAADFTAVDGPLAKPDEQLKSAILNGYNGSIGRMPAFKSILNEGEITAVLTYIRAKYQPQVSSDDKSQDSAGAALKEP